MEVLLISTCRMGRYVLRIISCVTTVTAEYVHHSLGIPDSSWRLLRHTSMASRALLRRTVDGHTRLLRSRSLP